MMNNDEIVNLIGIFERGKPFIYAHWDSEGKLHVLSNLIPTETSTEKAFLNYKMLCTK